MGEFFGTDGVRGIPGRYPLVPDFIRRLGFVSANLLREGRKAHANGSAPVILMGRDSRASGAALGRSLAHGFAKAGCVTLDLGVLPTPALSYLTPRRAALCGVMISASHNPAEFNGIKFFTAGGFKMGPELEAEIERRLAGVPDPGASVSTVAVGAEEGGQREYLDFLRSSFPATSDLSGLRIVVDCANGAASAVAPRLFESLGARVFPVGCRPNGKNINSGCGALETGAMRREVWRRRAHCGVSLDGDADRAIFSDETGSLCDGDVLISMAALDLRERGLLRGNKVVLTVMSNYGMIEFLSRQGISSTLVPVGDRNVTEALEREGLVLGGEASGHIVFRRFSPTGDGLLTALQTLAVMARGGRPMSFFRKRYKTYPQLLSNVRIDRRIPIEQLPGTWKLIRRAQKRLEGRGRVLVRYSGTEPLMRVLVEGPDRAACRKISSEIIETFQKESRVPGEH